MGVTTNISWCTSTYNPWIGCAHVSPGCENCYAEALMATRWGKVEWGPGKTRARTKTWRDPIRWNEEAKARAARGEDAPWRVFCASLADWLDAEAPVAWLADLLVMVERTPFLTWMLLTKRLQNWRPRLEEAHRLVVDEAERMMPRVNGFLERWLDGDAPANVWLGTSVEDQRRADERVPMLLDTPARVRFLSMEPLLGPVDLGEWLLEEDGDDDHPAIGWVIVGGESGRGARPMHPAWARSLRDQAKAAGTAFHFKQWGEWLPSPGASDPGLLIDVDGRTFDSRAAVALGASLAPGIPIRQPTPMLRVGKGAAGHLLDGEALQAFPS